MELKNWKFSFLYNGFSKIFFFFFVHQVSKTSKNNLYLKTLSSLAPMPIISTKSRSPSTIELSLQKDRHIRSTRVNLTDQIVQRQRPRFFIPYKKSNKTSYSLKSFFNTIFQSQIFAIQNKWNKRIQEFLQTSEKTYVYTIKQKKKKKHGIRYDMPRVCLIRRCGGGEEVVGAHKISNYRGAKLSATRLLGYCRACWRIPYSSPRRKLSGYASSAEAHLYTNNYSFFRPITNCVCECVWHFCDQRDKKKIFW